MLAMILFGVGEVLGCFFIGYFIDRIGNKKSVLINLVLILIMTGVTISFLYVMQYNALAFVMCFMWGFQDSAINTHLYESVGFEFDDNYTPYAVCNIWNCLMCFAFQLIYSNIDTTKVEQFFPYTIATCVIGFLCCGTTYFFPFRSDHIQQ